MTEQNKWVEAFDGKNPMEEFFPGDPQRQWITASLITLATARQQFNSVGDVGMVQAIDALANKAPIECIIAATTMMVAVTQ